jgi:2-amino-4-hydroxy-6-hydroxymethyldihydropteridine diphosphokinase
VDKFVTECAIGLGSNLGESLGTFQGALQALATTPHIELLAVSNLYRSKAIGPIQPDYYNAVALITTTLAPEDLLIFLLALEQQWGRTRTLHWGPRTLDLDLLLYGDLIYGSPTLTVPHPHLLVRNFALIPLAQLRPHWVHPLAQQPMITLAQQLTTTGLVMLGG